jgi:hypothetical protein
LQSDLSSGQSLQSIASAAGVPSTQLVSTISQSLQSANPGLSSSQATSIATAISQRSGGGGHHHHHGGGGGESGTSSSAGATSSDSGLSALLTALNLSSSSSAPSTSTTTSDDSSNQLAELLGTGSSNTADNPQNVLDTLL